MPTTRQRLEALEAKTKQLRAKVQRQEAAAKKRQSIADRKADAHRKIGLGGLVIAAGADDWNPAEIVGALLAIGERLKGQPEGREQLREKGINHLAEREANKAK